MPESLDKKTEELIAVGVAYAINCVNCMKVHRKAALAAGACPDEMQRAIKVAEGVVTGARNVSKKEAKFIFSGEDADNTSSPITNGCCP